MKKTKKGMIVTKTLVTIILLIIGFSIALIVYYQLSWTGRVDREVCHQSVIYRATLPALGGLKEYVPLKCKTQKICITSGFIGGKCEEEFENAKGVLKIKVKNEKQINKAIAQEIVDCWSMMGEGKVSIFAQWLATEFGIDDVYPSCVICSRIAFDEARLEKAGINLEKVDVMGYMRRYKVPGKEATYYEYLIGEGGKISVGDLFEETTEDDKEKINRGAEDFIERIKEQDPAKIGDFQQGEVEIEDHPGDREKQEEIIAKYNKEYSDTELAVMFMQISAPSHGGVLRNTLKAGAAVLGLSLTYKPGAFVTQLGRVPAGKTITIGAKTYKGGQFLPKAFSFKKLTITPFTKIVAALAIITLGVQQGNVAYNRAVTANYCADISYGGEAKEGCSVVRTINYNRDEILQYCSVIESIE